MVIITSIIIPFCILIDSRAIKYYLIIEIMLIALFSTDNLLVFYVLYEGILIPMFMLVAQYGKSYNRFYATKQFVVYTVAAGLFMLVGIIYLMITYHSLSITYLSNIVLTPKESLLLCIAFLIGFLVKIPVVPIHIWLPEAHTEASTSASVILAAIIIKIATYGIIRIIYPITSIGIIYTNSILITIYVISIIYSGLSCIKQIDLKKVVAYSSIVHMNFAMLGTTSESSLGIVATILILVSHTFISSAMFTLVGIIYSITKTRKIPLLTGLSSVLPIASCFALVIFFANMALPCFSGFVGEYLLTIALVSQNLTLTILASSVMLISTIYSLVLYTKVFHGQYFSTLRIKDISRKEFHILFGYLI